MSDISASIIPPLEKLSDLLVVPSGDTINKGKHRLICVVDFLNKKKGYLQILSNFVCFRHNHNKLRLIFLIVFSTLVKELNNSLNSD